MVGRWNGGDGREVLVRVVTHEMLRTLKSKFRGMGRDNYCIGRAQGLEDDFQARRRALKAAETIAGRF